jgi:hypothetical protein
VSVVATFFRGSRSIAPTDELVFAPVALQWSVVVKSQVELVLLIVLILLAALSILATLH